MLYALRDIPKGTVIEIARTLLLPEYFFKRIKSDYSEPLSESYREDLEDYLWFAPDSTCSPSTSEIGCGFAMWIYGYGSFYSFVTDVQRAGKGDDEYAQLWNVEYEIYDPRVPNGTFNPDSDCTGGGFVKFTAAVDISKGNKLTVPLFYDRDSDKHTVHRQFAQSSCMKTQAWLNYSIPLDQFKSDLQKGRRAIIAREYVNWISQLWVSKFLKRLLLRALESVDQDTTDSDTDSSDGDNVSASSGFSEGETENDALTPDEEFVSKLTTLIQNNRETLVAFFIIWHIVISTLALLYVCSCCRQCFGVGRRRRRGSNGPSGSSSSRGGHDKDD